MLYCALTRSDSTFRKLFYTVLSQNLKNIFCLYKVKFPRQTTPEKIIYYLVLSTN